MAAGDEFDAHLERLDGTGGARLDDQPDGEHDAAEDEKRVRPQHEQPDAAQDVGRGADDRSDDPAHRARGQFVAP